MKTEKHIFAEAHCPIIFQIQPYFLSQIVPISIHKKRFISSTCILHALKVIRIYNPIYNSKLDVQFYIIVIYSCLLRVSPLSLKLWNIITVWFMPCYLGHSFIRFYNLIEHFEISGNRFASTSSR